MVFSYLENQSKKYRVELTGHHTCSTNFCSAESILQGGLPTAYAEYKLASSKPNPFLGSGYYFWDYNLEMAITWGKQRYTQDFWVFEADLVFEEYALLDLVGNRKHIAYLVKAMEVFGRYNPRGAQKDWHLSDLIECLKRLKKDDNTLFPYSAVRAIDHSLLREQQANKLYFTEKNGKFSCLNPTIIVCVFSDYSNIIKNLRLCHERQF